jgi:glycosyltransferase involved in cell wall biosynthesis
MKGIVRNLTELYKKAFPSQDLRFQSVGGGKGLGDLKSLDHARQTVRDWRPDQIVFIDDYPHPGEFIRLLTRSDYKPKFIVHLFGSFTYFSDRWSFENEALFGQNIRWICASSRSANLLRTCLKGPDRISILPLPLDPDLFFWCPKTRLEMRAEMGLGLDTRLLVYTGRIQLQKGVDRLLDHLEKLNLQEGLSLQIALAGEFDDSGVPLFGVRGELGFQFLSIQASMQNLNYKAGSTFLKGKLNQSQIRSLLCAADAFCSLSLFNDEDYGMAPAEAGFCGLPLFLTDWGGYSDFKLTKDCFLFPTELTSHGVSYSSENFVKQLKDCLNRPLMEPDFLTRRENQSKAFHQRLSIPALAPSLKEIFAQDFSPSQGFNELHKDFAELAQRKSRLPSIPFGEDAFHHVYRSYSSSAQIEEKA